MKRVAMKGDFEIYWDCNTLTYTVYYKGKILVTGKTKYSQVKPYVE